MNENPVHFTLYGKPPVYQICISLLIIIFVGIFLFLVAMLAGSRIFHINPSAFSADMLAGSEKNIGYVRYLLIFQDICLFIVPSFIILNLIKPDWQKGLYELKMPGTKDILLVVLLAICIFPITSFTGELNAGMHLPRWLSGVEKWMTEKETSANDLIDLLIVSKTFVIMMFNLLMIAVLPAIGEELLFRGVFQKILSDLFRSGHLAVWFTAFLFSALHFQFFGFIPRFILGLIFGYLFLWSGTLWLPVIAHFINNAVPVIGELFHVTEKLTYQPDGNLWKQMIALPLPVILSVLILIYFRNKSRRAA